MSPAGTFKDRDLFPLSGAMAQDVEACETAGHRRVLIERRTLLQTCDTHKHRIVVI